MAESGLPMKYWADAIQTVVYVRNLLPNSQQPKTIPAELWSGQCQDILHLQPFGCTSYAHIPLDLNLSKLNLRSVKTALLGYFGRDGYKLLDKSTGAVFKLRDVIFEEGTTHLAKQPTPVVFYNDNDPFIYKLLPNNNATSPDNGTSPNPTSPPIQGIAPRPLANCDVHNDSKDTQRTPTNNNTATTTEKELDEESSKIPKDLPLAIKNCKTKHLITGVPRIP